MPTPTKNEKKKDFLERCMAFPDMQKYPSGQRYAVCESKWTESRMSELKQANTKISFDYDGTLSTDLGKKIAERQQGTLYIISARHHKDGMLTVAESLGIPPSRVFALGSNAAKIQKIKELGITNHYDNNKDVVSQLGSVGKLI